MRGQPVSAVLDRLLIGTPETVRTTACDSDVVS